MINSDKDLARITTVQKEIPLEITLSRYIKRKEGLHDSLIPCFKQFMDIGFSELQLDQIVNIPFENAYRRGRNNKVSWFMNAITKNYSKDDLALMTTNYDRFNQFLELANEVEDFRAGIGDGGDPTVVYALCFDMIHFLGKERTQILFDEILNEESTDTPIWKKIKALYCMKGIFEESKKTGYLPESILAFRRNTLDSCFYDSNNPEEDITE